MRLPAQERMLQEFQTILGDINATVEELSSPENSPYVLVSNLIKVSVPEVVYVAELCIDEEGTIAAAQRDFGYKGKRPRKQLLVKLALRIAGLESDGWAIHENKIFTFYDIEREPALRPLIFTPA